VVFTTAWAFPKTWGTSHRALCPASAHPERHHHGPSAERWGLLSIFWKMDKLSITWPVMAHYFVSSPACYPLFHIFVGLLIFFSWKLAAFPMQQLASKRVLLLLVNAVDIAWTKITKACYPFLFSSNCAPNLLV